MIFEDPRRKRWKRILIFFCLLVVVAAGSLGLAIFSAFSAPPLPQPYSNLPDEKKARIHAESAHIRSSLRELNQKRPGRKNIPDRKDTRTLPEGSVIAFLIQDDPASVASLERHVDDIDFVIPDYYHLTGHGCEIADTIDKTATRILSRSSTAILPRIANIGGGKWMGQKTGEILRKDKLRTCIVQGLLTRLKKEKSDGSNIEGINIDFEGLDAADVDVFLEFLVELKKGLQAEGMRLTVDVTLTDPSYDVEYIAALADATMVMLYDEHYTLSDAGPVASRAWFRDSVEEALLRVPEKERLVILLGGYGYDWSGPKSGVPITFRTAMDLARSAAIQPVFEEEEGNTHFVYTSAAEGGKTHHVWVLDALSFWDQTVFLFSKGITSSGIWRLGTEDESLWSFYTGDKPTGSPAAKLEKIPASRSLDVTGYGEVLVSRASPDEGRRDIRLTENDEIESAVYVEIPHGFTLHRKHGRAKDVVLTFDDGPDEFTPAILDVLKREKVPAHFFVIGQQVTFHPESLIRMAEEGHLIGNHSFTHPHMETLTPLESRWQLSSTERLIGGVVGRYTPLYRPPFTAEIDSHSDTYFRIVYNAFKNGYIVVGASVDSQDWQKPGVEEIRKNVVKGVTSGRGNIILMHDGGGDRSQTVDAIPLFVSDLRALGYNFVSLDRYLGVSRANLEIEPPFAEKFVTYGNTILYLVRSKGWTVLSVLFYICTILAILRILVLGTLTILQVKTTEEEVLPDGFAPLVTVLVPAYNEEKVIEHTIESLRKSSYRNLEILVIDDGSKDKTASIAKKAARKDKRVRVLTQENSGKAEAANLGIREARGEILVAVDADTQIPNEAIKNLIRHFAKPEVTAVCGNVEVGNIKGMLTTFQAIEYITSQNFDRRAFSAINCISVVPGALGAWRKKDVLRVGGYSGDTLTEDADMTLSILRAGGKVVYEPDARAQTEAPEKVSALLRQRFRWTFGTYQCLWKHKSGFLKGSLGWVGLPNMVLFQILFPMLSPLGDFVMLFSIFTGQWESVLSGYLGFLAMDLAGAALAFSLDKKPFYWLFWLLIQRFTYRQLMYFVSLKAMLAVLQGKRRGWQKLSRSGSLTQLRPAS